MFETMVVVFLIVAVSAKDPPILPDSYFQAFDETINLPDGIKQHTTAQLFYDAAHNRHRMDRANGKFQLFCSSVMPDFSTPCTHIVLGSKRYLIFPEKRHCCYCCDSAHGCGILKPTWLQGGKYLGTQKLDGVEYDKWEKDGGQKNYWWATTDSKQIPRRLQEANIKIDDFRVSSFVEKTFEDGIFALPDYCHGNCHLLSLCGALRSGNLKAA